MVQEAVYAKRQELRVDLVLAGALRGLKHIDERDSARIET